MEKSCLPKLLAKLRETNVTEPLVRRDGQLERRALQVIGENLKIVWLNMRVLGRVPEEIVRMLHDKLIERSRGSDEHRARTSCTPSRAAGPLPGRSNRSRIPGHHTGIEGTNVDSKFERVCSDHSQNAAVAQTAFNLAPFSWQIASTVSANRFFLAWFRRIRLLQIGQNDFRVQPGIGEDDRLQLPAKDLFRDSRGFVDVLRRIPRFRFTIGGL